MSFTKAPGILVVGFNLQGVPEREDEAFQGLLVRCFNHHNHLVHIALSRVSLGVVAAGYECLPQLVRPRSLGQHRQYTRSALDDETETLAYRIFSDERRVRRGTPDGRIKWYGLQLQLVF